MTNCRRCQTTNPNDAFLSRGVLTPDTIKRSLGPAFILFMPSESKEPIPNDQVPEYFAAVERLTQHVQVVHDILGEIHDELQWAVRNGEAIRLERLTITADQWCGRLRQAAETPAETGTCYHCDATFDSLAEALRRGWRDLQQDVKGLSWNYLGCCPDCPSDDAEHEFSDDEASTPDVPEPTTTAATQRELF